MTDIACQHGVQRSALCKECHPEVDSEICPRCLWRGEHARWCADKTKIGSANSHAARMVAARDAAIGERDAMLAELTETRAERDALLTRLNLVTESKDALSVQLTAANRELGEIKRSYIRRALGSEE